MPLLKKQATLVAVALVTLLGSAACKRKKNLDGRLDDLEQPIGRAIVHRIELERRDGEGRRRNTQGLIDSA